MQAVEPMITEAVLPILKVDNAVAARRSFGGTAPDEIRARIADATKRFHLS
jgi:argininosuccinate lyase